MTQRLNQNKSNKSAERSFHAVVTDVRERVRKNGHSLWEIALDQTAFSPASGEEPCDTGVLRAISRSGAELEAAVIEVAEDENGEIWHCTSKPLNAGTAVTGEVNWPRRR
jgi:alanyl-tRNA synthetase